MAEFDHGIKEIARSAGKELARLAGVECQSWQPLEGTLQTTTERLADRAFLARSGRERFVVYMEFFTTWNRNAPWNLLSKSALLSENQKLPTVTLVFVLSRRGYRPQKGQFRLEFGGAPTQQLWFHEVPMWEQKPQNWWEQVPSLMTLYPLCRHERRPREAIKYAANAIEARDLGIVEKADLLTILDIFGELAYPRLDVTEIIGSERMKETKLFKKWRAETIRENILDLMQPNFEEEDIHEFEKMLTTVNDSVRLKELLLVAARNGGRISPGTHDGCNRSESIKQSPTTSRNHLMSKRSHRLNILIAFRRSARQDMAHPAIRLAAR